MVLNSSLPLSRTILAVAKDTSAHPVAYIHSLRSPGSRSSPACPAGSGSSALLRCQAHSCPEPEQSEHDLQNHQVWTFNSLVFFLFFFYVISDCSLSYRSLLTNYGQILAHVLCQVPVHDLPVKDVLGKTSKFSQPGSFEWLPFMSWWAEIGFIPSVVWCWAFRPSPVWQQLQRQHVIGWRSSTRWRWRWRCVLYESRGLFEEVFMTSSASSNQSLTFCIAQLQFTSKLGIVL